jgi:hypothetical protein
MPAMVTLTEQPSWRVGFALLAALAIPALIFSAVSPA